MINKNLFLLNEIELPNIGKIYQPMTKDLLKLSEDDFNSLIYPFTITIDDFEISEDSIKEIEIKLGRKITNFDCIFFNERFINDTLKTLKYFYKSKDVYIQEYIFERFFFINYFIKEDKLYPMENAIIISYGNWDELCELIKGIMNLSEVKKEKREVTIKDEANRELLEEYLRLQKQQEEHNKKLAEKNKVTLHDIVTIVASDCDWNYERVENMTYYKLINAQKTIIEKDSYLTNLMYHTSEKYDTTKMKIKHWTDGIRKN